VHGANPKGKYRTPTGRFRVSAKHLTADMGGTVGGGSWRSRDVPWVAYFHGGYALHGAWWHDRFGAPRSHGCINLTPGDAFTLFRWLDPQVPEGWYAARADAQHPGTVVLITP
jgi:lipoprotein-anchoring transpeptidase ErfK/SrfK